MRRFWAGVLSATVLAAAFPAAVWAGENSFMDIEGHWAIEAIENAVEENWISGKTPESFAPEEGITRGEFFLALARMDNAPESVDQPFSDVEATAGYAPYINWGIKHQLISGAADGTFQPGSVISREDAAVMLYRYLTYRQNELTPVETATAEDAELVSDYAAAAVSSLWNAGIFVGSDGSFHPKASLTRAEAAVLAGRIAALPEQRQSEIKTIPSFDGYPLVGKLSMPDTDHVEKVVVFVNGSGPNTYDNCREYNGKQFNYFDVFADNFTQKGIAFFRSNTRGVTLGTEPPMFDQINEEEYQTYLPENTVRDTEEIVRALKQDDRLKDAKVYLLGWSEGTMIAPKVAQRGNVQIDALLLGGYCNDTMEEIWNWQQSGESSMIYYRQCFDYDGDGHITRAEFEEDRYQMQSYVGAAFDQLDVNLNGELDADDLRQIQAPFRGEMLSAVENRDDAWLKEHYAVQLTSGWFLAHREFQPNREMLAELTVPIHIFHGDQDLNVSVQGVYDIAAEFEKLGKTNLTTHIYEGAEHNLNVMNHLIGGEMPQGFIDLFRVAAEL